MFYLRNCVASGGHNNAINSARYSRELTITVLTSGPESKFGAGLPKIPSGQSRNQFDYHSAATWSIKRYESLVAFYIHMEITPLAVSP